MTIVHVVGPSAAWLAVMATILGASFCRWSRSYVGWMFGVGAIYQDLAGVTLIIILNGVFLYQQLYIIVVNVMLHAPLYILFGVFFSENGSNKLWTIFECISVGGQ